MESMEERFLYHAPSTEGVKSFHEAVSRKTLELAKWLYHHLPDGRGKDLALTNLEEVRMWSNQAVAMSQAELKVDTQ